MHIRTRTDTAYTFFLFTVLAIVLAYILIRLYLDIISGGHLWRQGDWLINNEYGFIRRGIFGSLLFFISDYSSINPLILLGIFQAIIITFVCSTLIVSVARLGPNTRVLWLLLSPSFILMFWFFDHHAIAKKEILVYFAYSILVLGIVLNLRNDIIMWLSSSVYVIAVLSHEGNFFFLPFFMFALLVFKNGLGSRQLYVIVLVVVAGSLGGLGYAIVFSKSLDPIFICHALLERGLSDNLCGGAIAFLGFDSDQAINFVNSQLVHSGLYIYYVMSYILSLIPLFFLRPAILSKATYYYAVCIGIIVFFPLFIIAYDWGRWINFYVTSVSFILIMHMNLRRDLYPLNMKNPPALKVFAFFHCFLWSMPHCCGPMGFGVPGFVIQVVSELAGGQ